MKNREIKLYIPSEHVYMHTKLVNESEAWEGQPSVIGRGVAWARTRRPYCLCALRVYTKKGRKRANEMKEREKMKP